MASLQHGEWRGKAKQSRGDTVSNVEVFYLFFSCRGLPRHPSLVPPIVPRNDVLSVIAS